MIEEFQLLKEERLLDIIHRVIANPQNAKKVAEALAKDWFPICTVTPQGKMEIRV